MGEAKQLAQLMARSEQAKQAVRQREGELRERTAELGRLRRELDEHERSVGAGAEPDPKLAEQVRRELALPWVAERPVEVRGRVTAELVDRRAEQRLEGARAAVAEAEDELRGFATERLPALEAELMAGSKDERTAALAAARELARALHPLLERHGRIVKLYSLAGRPGQAPDAPFDELRRGLAGMERG